LEDKFSLGPLQGAPKKEIVMKRNSVGTLSLAALSLMLTTVAARAQSIEEANIPFAFYAGAAQFPAGHYLISEDHARGSIKISNLDTGRVAAIYVQQGSTASAKTALVFHNVGGMHFLREVQGTGDSLNLSVPPSKAEKQAIALKMEAAAAPASEHTLIALK
jgi:N-methylhydantoinase A/oxoprolinase/acetone carboxylase beta subunit